MSSTPPSGYRLRPVHLDSVPRRHTTSESPSPPPSSTMSVDVDTPHGARMPPPTQVLPSLMLSPTHPNAPPRPWSPSAGVREIDAAPPQRRAGLPTLTGHELMALFPAPSPSSPPTYAVVNGSAPIAGPNGTVPIPIPTSGWFASQEKAFFAREGKEIVRLRKEEALGIESSGAESSHPSVGMKREREREQGSMSAKRSPSLSHTAPPPPPPASSYQSHPPAPPQPPPSHHPSHSQSHPQALALAQPQPLQHQTYRPPPPPPPRDREPIVSRDSVRDRERTREMGENTHMRVEPPMNALGRTPPHTHVHPQHQTGRNHPSQAPQHPSSTPPPQGRQPPYAPPPQQQHSGNYTYSHTPPPAPSSHPHAPPPHARSSYTHPPPAPQARANISYSVQPPHQLPLQPNTHPSYSAAPPPVHQSPPPQQHAYSASPPNSSDDYMRRERERERGRELRHGHEPYPSPSPSREGYSHSHSSSQEVYAPGSAYLAASERRRAGKHTRRVVVKA